MNIDLARPLLSRLRLGIGIIAVAVPSDAAVSVDFRQLIHNPLVYQQKHVSVTGVAAVDETTFVLFRPPRRELAQSIFVAQKVGGPKYNHVDNRWVTITGIAEVDKHKIFACKILFESVELLAGPPVKAAKVFGIFANEGTTPVKLDVVNKAGNEHTEIPLAPGQIEKTVVVEGIANVFEPSGKLLTRCNVKSESSAPDFFDASARTFYFRIRDGKISPVKVHDAAPLRRRWENVEKQR